MPKFTKENAAEMGAKGGRNSKRKPLSDEWKDVSPQKLLDMLMQQAEGGSTKAVEVIIDRIWGKVTQGLDHTTGGEKINNISDLSTEELIKRAEAIKKIDEQA